MGGGLHVACACLQGDGLRHETTLMGHGGEGEHCFHLLDSGRGILGTVRCLYVPFRPRLLCRYVDS